MNFSAIIRWQRRLSSSSLTHLGHRRCQRIDGRAFRRSTNRTARLPPLFGAIRTHFRRMLRNSFGPEINVRFRRARSSSVAASSPSLLISRLAISAALGAPLLRARGAGGSAAMARSTRRRMASARPGKSSCRRRQTSILAKRLRLKTNTDKFPCPRRAFLGCYRATGRGRVRSSCLPSFLAPLLSPARTRS
jgi:hypothetical protein